MTSNLVSKELWVLKKIHSQSDDPPTSTRWRAWPAEWADAGHTSMKVAEGKRPLDALVVGTQPWSLEEDAQTLYPLGELGLDCLSPTKGRIILGSLECGPAPAWAEERGQFNLAKECFFIEPHGFVRTYYIAEPGLWPSVAYR